MTVLVSKLKARTKLALKSPKKVVN